jgi:hypothetical protein
MTRKNALFALFAVVLMGSVAGAALADDHGMYLSGSQDSSLTAEPERNLWQFDAGEIREPVETGAVPDWSERSSDLHSNPSGDAPTVEYGGQTFRLIDIGS